MKYLSTAAGLALAVAACTCRAQSRLPVHPAALGLSTSQRADAARAASRGSRIASVAKGHIKLAAYVRHAAHSLSILDADGLVVHRLSPSAAWIATSSLPPGTYVIEARDAAGTTLLVQPFLIGEVAAETSRTLAVGTAISAGY